MSTEQPATGLPADGAEIRPVPVDLDGMVCFALYSASRALTAKYRELLAPLGLTYPQYLVMIVVWQTGQITVRDLGRRLQLDSGTLSPLVKRLETTGLVTRRRRVDDERSVVIDLTPAGDRLRHRAADIPAAICAATGLSVDDLDGLRVQIDLLADTVRGTITESVAPVAR